MLRRDFLSSFGVKASAVAAVPALVAASVADRGREVKDKSSDILQKQLKQLNDKVDSMDASYKRSFRAVLVLTAVTTGVDVASLPVVEIWFVV